ncbi:hypothetical protein [Microbulbifer thermotolerans]|uniref:Uncharacterized protein n=1 Tax=Microbulbifer thermotolerans TaxID=252514 RepID=A0A143HM52_MICTH|nr:hypothetical protein [Microbulbifer thermotolerans]AMX02794.1 hypothetical protein A3224_09575 [Microbulbifer thermotolerans]MCX2779657.1 hypothetical protein [Microbulbifer thermotolerans]MCX2794635.1 hypothetical protein [Microbulbifer thermotolerans]MCX2801463.1 hypothetical protein [Microbulbifer thermotolerans]MCX2804912.1 hypothetical protein [Microbulbifer thermotolerans]
MLDDLHIHDFYRNAGRILLALFNQFPTPATVYVEDISGPDTPDEYGLHSPRHLACLGAMTWLKQSGYIHFSQLVRQEAIEEAVLTHKGFLLLINKVESGESNAQLLDEAVRHGSSMEMQALMERLMRAFSAL